MSFVHRGATETVRSRTGRPDPGQPVGPKRSRSIRWHTGWSAKPRSAPANRAGRACAGVVTPAAALSAPAQEKSRYGPVLFFTVAKVKAPPLRDDPVTMRGLMTVLVTLYPTTPSRRRPTGRRRQRRSGETAALNRRPSTTRCLRPCVRSDREARIHLVDPDLEKAPLATVSCVQSDKAFARSGLRAMTACVRRVSLVSSTCVSVAGGARGTV